MHQLSNITERELRILEEVWLDAYHSTLKEESNGRRWYKALLRFFDKRGDIVIPGALIDEEARVLEQGLAKEYLAKLTNAIDSSHARSEAEWAVLLLSATPEERLDALGQLRADQYQASKKEGVTGG